MNFFWGWGGGETQFNPSPRPAPNISWVHFQLFREMPSPRLSLPSALETIAGRGVSGRSGVSWAQPGPG